MTRTEIEDLPNFNPKVDGSLDHTRPTVDQASEGTSGQCLKVRRLVEACQRFLETAVRIFGGCAMRRRLGHIVSTDLVTSEVERAIFRPPLFVLQNDEYL